MRNFRQWRKMTWTILLAAVLGSVWVIATWFSPSVLGFSLGVIGLLWVLWYYTEPLWRQGRGAHLQRRHAPAVHFKPVKSLVQPRPGPDA